MNTFEKVSDHAVSLEKTPASNPAQNVNLTSSANSIVLTGDRPTGPLHLGHYVGSLKLRVELQASDNPLYVLIADTQTLNNDISKSAHAKRHTLDVMRDYMGVGLDPEKVTVFLQSEVTELFELTNYLSNLVSHAQIMRIPTIKSENALYNTSLNMGFLNYPVSQSADVMLFNAARVPVGEDQLPILEFTNDLIAKFNHSFKVSQKHPLFSHITPLLSDHPRLPGIKGKSDVKMSKSLDNAIFLSDSDEAIKRKINSMYTDPGHLKVSDPGCVDDHVVFKFLSVFHSDRAEIEALKSHYQRGGLGDSTLKAMLFDDLKKLIAPIRERGQAYSDRDLQEILSKGTEKAKSVASRRMKMIKDAIFK